MPARLIRERFAPSIAERMDELCWWDWEHDRLFAALEDFRALAAEEFVEKYAR